MYNNVMKRDYQEQPLKDVIYFVGDEVEHTSHYGEKTLFVVGIRPAQEILEQAQSVSAQHVYLGANKSFRPSESWKEVTARLLDEGLSVTLDYPVWQHYDVVRVMGDLMSHERLTPMISVEIPHVEQLNPNATVKIDDIDFNSTNSGVWCHPLRSLLDPGRYTPWTAYGQDEVIE